MLQEKLSQFNKAVDSQKAADAAVLDVQLAATQAANEVVRVRDEKTTQHQMKSAVLRAALGNPKASVKITITVTDAADEISLVNTEGASKYPNFKNLDTELVELTLSAGEIRRAMQIKGNQFVLDVLSLTDGVSQIKQSDYASFINALRTGNYQGELPISLQADLGETETPKEEAQSGEEAGKESGEDAGKEAGE